ncbi:MAG TPA: cytidine deaminase [Patescibacteria group bacterium]|nr:cytidine deaminase [Patescibacteria group bacterium]
MVKIAKKHLLQLIKAAVKVRKNAYNPYSHYSVGASILTVSGRIYVSCNAETVSYTGTDHAESSTITRAIADGEVKRSGRKFIKALVVVHEGKSGPCGLCRQRIAEHADDCLIFDVSPNGKIDKTTSLKKLLPYAFTPTHLGIK